MSTQKMGFLRREDYPQALDEIESNFIEATSFKTNKKKNISGKRKGSCNEHEAKV
jgi:hypothetical protein